MVRELTESRRYRAWGCLVVAAACVLGGPAVAQESELVQVKAATSLTSDQVGIITQWVTQHVDAMIAAEGATAVGKAAGSFAIAYAGGSAAFQTAFAGECATVFAPYLADASSAPNVALAMASVLAKQARPAAVPALQKGLTSPHAVVRYWAGKGLVGLRRAVADSPVAADVVTSLQAAGVAEKEDLVLQAIYAALNVKDVSSQPTLTAQAAMAIVVVLKVQTDRRVANKLRRAGADLVGYEALGAMLGDVDDATRKTAVSVAVKALGEDVAYYATIADAENVPDKRQTILLIEQVEVFLRQALRASGETGPVPDILGKLKVADLEGANVELGKWVGRPDAEGVLNRPFGLPAGILTPPTAPAAAAEPAAEQG